MHFDQAKGWANMSIPTQNDLPILSGSLLIHVPRTA